MRRFLALLALTSGVLFSTIAAKAGTLTVSESGTFSSNTPATSYSTPGGSYSFTFNIASMPVTAAVSGSEFLAPITNFSYVLNGVATSATSTGLTIFSQSDDGLFNLCFGAACLNPTNGFEFTGPQIYSGPQSAPTILIGSYTPIGSHFVSSGAVYTPASSTPVSITSSAAVTPEPSSIALLGTGVLVFVGVFRRRLFTRSSFAY